MSSSSPTEPANRLPHLPGLDGLRAFAVVLVLLFHNGFTWMEGGFLGVSVFFTLSGYLITTLLLHEHAHSDGVSLRAFWGRRFRRLLPASLLAIALAIAFGVFAADPTQRAELGGDVIASLAYAANWWFLSSDQTYAALFSEPSPLLHFWSLAIEEQFYLLLPLAAFAAIGRRRVFTIGTLAVLAITVALPFATTVSEDWLYYATPARLPELLTGVLLALVLARGDLRQRLTASTARVLPTIVGVGALGATIWLAATSTIASSWLYRGGFAAFSVISVTLIVASHSPRGLATRLLALPPIQHLGRISYGVYLYHWPLFLWLDTARTGLDGWGLFAVRMAATLTLAEISYRFVEMPIRRTGRLTLPGALPRLSRLAPVAIVILIAAGVLTSLTAPPKAVDFDLAAESLASLDELSTSPPSTVVATDDVDAVLAQLPTEPPTPRVGVFGDSTALMTGFGLGGAMAERPGVMDYAEGVTLLGCGLNLGGSRLRKQTVVYNGERRCRTWPTYWSERARANSPNVALVQIGPWDVMTRQVETGGPFLNPGDPAWDQAVLDEMLFAVDLLSRDGAYTLWATAPLPNSNLDVANHFAGPDNTDPARFAHLNTLIAKLPELRPGKVAVVDLASWHSARSDDEELRPDGVHLGRPGGLVLGREFLLDEIDRKFDTAWRSGAIPQLIAESVVARQRRLAPPTITAGEPLRVAVWSDARSAELGEQVTGGARAAGLSIDVRVLGNADCGVARVAERRFGAEIDPADPRCQDRRGIAGELEAFNPHLVIVGPGLNEAAEHRPWTDWGQWKAPGDTYIDVWLLREYASAVDLAGRNGALVAVVGLGPGQGEPYTAAINKVVFEVAKAPDRSTWLAGVPAADAAAWAFGRLGTP